MSFSAQPGLIDGVGGGADRGQSRDDGGPAARGAFANPRSVATKRSSIGTPRRTGSDACRPASRPEDFGIGRKAGYLG